MERIAELQEQLAAARAAAAEVAPLRDELSALRADLDSRERSRAEMAQRLQELEQREAQRAEERLRLETRLAAEEERTGALEREVEELQSRHQALVRESEMLLQRTAEEQIGDAPSALEAVERVVLRWASARSHGRTVDVVASYSADFTPPGGDRAGWERSWHRALAAPARVELRDLETRVEGHRAVATFLEVVEGRDGTRAASRRLLLQQENGVWRILEERSG